MYLIHLDGIDLSKVLITWLWLVGNNKIIIALTRAGDALLKDVNRNLYFLNTRIGELELISDDYLYFSEEKLDSTIYNKFLLPNLIDSLEEAGKILKCNQVYTHYKSPLISGVYHENNVYIVNIYEHYNLTGEIHFQLKDVLDETKVGFKYS